MFLILLLFFNFCHKNLHIFALPYSAVLKPAQAGLVSPILELVVNVIQLIKLQIQLTLLNWQTILIKYRLQTLLKTFIIQLIHYMIFKRVSFHHWLHLKQRYSRLTIIFLCPLPDTYLNLRTFLNQCRRRESVTLPLHNECFRNWRFIKHFAPFSTLLQNSTNLFASSKTTSRSRYCSTENAIYFLAHVTSSIHTQTDTRCQMLHWIFQSLCGNTSIIRNLF